MPGRRVSSAGSAVPVLVRHLVTWLRTACPSWAFILLLCASNGARAQPSLTARLVQEGLAHCEAGRYREAINALEEAWELDRSNPTVAEYLALAYLYEEHPPALAAFNRAEELMRISLEQDGRATVHARHLHRGLQWLTNMDDSCPGRLVISRRGIDFIAEDGHHSFSLVTDGILVAEVAKRRLSKYEGGIQLDAADGTKYPMLVGTQTWAEAQLFVDLARQFTLGG